MPWCGASRGLTPHVCSHLKHRRAEGRGERGKRTRWVLWSWAPWQPHTGWLEFWGLYWIMRFYGASRFLLWCFMIPSVVLHDSFYGALWFLLWCFMIHSMVLHDSCCAAQGPLHVVVRLPTISLQALSATSSNPHNPRYNMTYLPVMKRELYISAISVWLTCRHSLFKSCY